MQVEGAEQKLAYAGRARDLVVHVETRGDSIKGYSRALGQTARTASMSEAEFGFGMTMPLNSTRERAARRRSRTLAS